MHCTAMQPRLSFLGILLYLCISHLVILAQGFSDAVVLGTICNKRQTQCTKPGDVSYPFARDGVCAVSESFGLISCSSDQPYWDAFKSAIDGVDDNLLTAPAITGIFRVDSYTYINLAWNMQYVDKTDCDSPISVDDVDDFVPNFINLTTFANGSLQFSSLKVYLLFNCTNPYSTLVPDVDKDSSICRSYQKKCSSLGTMSCVQWTPFQELAIHDALQKLSCTHFQSVVQTDSLFDSEWNTGMVQLAYGGDIRCETCFNSNGQCVYNKVTHHFETCICGENQFSQTDCHHAKAGCNHFLCNSAAKIAIGVATTTVASFVLFVLCCTCLCTRKYSLLQKMPKFVTKRSMTPQLVLRSSSHSFSHLNLDGLTERPIEYTYGSIVSATNSFCNLLGEGGFGAVYKGTLTHANDDLCIQIAAKVLEVRISNHHKKQFLNEVATIGRIHHVHVVRLLGICIEENHQILIYEYVINGSLDKWLFNKNQVLHWEQRYAIAVGIAKGLGYLHEECRHRIVHCDIKPQNILLDAKMCPKIADFGLARLMGRDESRVATVAKGTPGYMAPEFWMGGESQVSTKFDVYSYGMVLLELMSGHRNFRDGVHFPEMAFEAAMRGDFESIIDVKLGITKPSDDHSRTSDAMQWQQVRTAALVALWCIQDHPMNRPSMSEVVQYLEGIAAINEQPPRPAITSALSVSGQQHPYFSNHHHYNITPISGGR